MITDAFGTATELALKAKLEGIGQGIAGTVLVILGLWVAIRIVHFIIMFIKIHLGKEYN